MAKKALIVGINNYQNPRNNLRGCVNDALGWSNILTTKFGFKSGSSVRMLLDDRATTANIIGRLHWLVDGAKAGDQLVFTFSGHGSQIVNTKYDRDDYEPDGLDEIICPYDINWDKNYISDDFLNKLFRLVPKGVELLVISDSCHSGTLLREADRVSEIKFGGMPIDNDFRHSVLPKRDILQEVSRFIPIPIDIACRMPSVRTSILDHDGQIDSQSISSAESKTGKMVPKKGILISGCKADQTSADTFMNNKWCGAMSAVAMTVLRSNNYNMTYQKLVDEVNSILIRIGYSQRPQLQCPNELKERMFLGGKSK
jgi:hypothetical protein